MRDFDPERLAELTMYIADRSATDNAFGKTKLVKLIAYADFTAYEQLGQSITGATYCKLEHGPAPRDLPDTLDELVGNEDLVQRRVLMGSFMATRYEARRTPDASVFSAEEIALVDSIIDRFKGVGGKAISDASHRDFAGWGMVDEFDDIPYRTALISQDEPTDAAMTAGRSALARLRIH